MAAAPPCPDPSVHEQHHKLSEQASTAALYATDPARKEEREDPLGADGKLSSRSAAASLKYAKAQDLPSFPSHGLDDANSAGKAALLAKDYKMKELWQPEQSAAGSKAALLAHKDGPKLDLWEPSASDAGHSAAVLAMRAKGLSPELDRGYTLDGKNRALTAATLSINRGSSSPKPTAKTGASYPDAENAGFNALNAATAVHRASTNKDKMNDPDGWESEAMQAARVMNLGKNVSNKEMWGERPPVRLERDEKEHNAALHASAVSMAKQMYEVQNRTVLGHDPGAADGAGAAHARTSSSGQGDLKTEAMRYIQLQDAAHKLAQERLAKVDKNFEAAKYREYYGYPDEKSSPKKGLGDRLSMRGRNKKDGDDELDSDDEQTARRIRHQMTQLSTGVNEVDEKKRSDDRARLLAAAEKRVQSRMHDLDEKVFMDTGKIPPSIMEDWEKKARERAQRDREEQAKNPGKTHIGGGKYMDQSEIEAIAAARLKPTLDEINENAEKKRQRDQELREEKEEQERQKREEKEKKREEKQRQQEIKTEEKAARQKEKDEAKARKSEEKRKSREVKREDGGAATATGDEAEPTEEEPTTTGTEKKRKNTLSRLFRRSDRKSTGEPAAQRAEEREAVGEAAAVGAGAAVAGEEAEGSHVKDDDQGMKDVTGHGTNAKEDETADRPRGLTHSGSYIDPGLAVAEDRDGKPDLERHISHIGHSDDEGEGADDDDISLDTTDRMHAAGIAKDHSELAEKGKQRFSSEHDRNVSTRAVHETSPTTESANAVGVIDPEHRYSGETDPCPPGSEMHKTMTATRLDPKLAGKVSPLSSPAADVPIDPERSESTAISALSPLNAHDTNLGSDSSAPAPRSTSVGDSTKTPGDETGPAPNTIGPHSSDAANVLDPRVKPDPSGLKAKEKHDEGRSTSDPRPTEKESKGVRGFFSRFKKDKQDNKQGSFMSGSSSQQQQQQSKASTDTAALTASSASEVPGDSTTTTTTIEDHPTAGGGIGLAATAEAAGDVSPSSFKRGEGGWKDLDDISSSGLDEDDFQSRGRESKREKTGNAGLKEKLGLKTGTTDARGGKAGETTEDEEENFEEARDHFDEGLAPPPAFGGQMKSSSPVRETRFKEEV